MVRREGMNSALGQPRLRKPTGLVPEACPAESGSPLRFSRVNTNFGSEKAALLLFLNFSLNSPIKTSSKNSP